MESRCRNHPTQKQLQGVCASCLREKLSRLSSASSRSQISTLPMIPSCNPDNGSSTLSSTGSEDHFSLSIHGGGGRCQRSGSRTVAFVVDVGGGRGGGLMRKSQSSITFVPRGGNFGEVKGKKKKGFWSKLIPAKGNKEGAVMMPKSKTLRERLNEIN